MRRPLRRRVEPRPDESVASLASRLAARNATGLRGFCLDMQLSLHAVHDARADMGRAVAELAGSDPNVFASTLTRIGDVRCRDWSYRGQQLKTEDLYRSCHRVCTLCLSDDLAQDGMKPEELASARAVWRIRHLRTCAVHRVALSEVDDEIPPYCHYDTAEVYRCLIHRLPDACREVVRREPSSFETYLSRRFDTGSGGVAWLDGKPLWAVASLVGHVGTVSLNGRWSNVKLLSAQDWWDVGAEGFALLADGPGGLTPVLDRLHDTYTYGDTGPDGPIRIYGRLWEWAERVAPLPEFDDLRNAIREHALSRLPIAAGSKVLGRTLDRRRVHSLRSIHVETGRDQRWIRRAFASHGLLPDGHEAENPKRLTFDADLVAPLVARLTAPMGTAEVLDHLGISVLQPLIRGGVITPLIDESGNGRSLEFAREDVLSLMSDLMRNAVLAETDELDHVDLVSACGVVTRKLADLIGMVRDRRLAHVWHRPTRIGLRSIVVSKQELRELVAGPVAAPLAEYQICERLHVHRKAVAQLITKGVLPSVTLPSPRGGRPSRYVTRDAVFRFQERHVTLTEIAAMRGTSIRNVKSDLVTQGIEPVLSPKEYRTAFYLRSEI